MTKYNPMTLGQYADLYGEVKDKDKVCQHCGKEYHCGTNEKNLKFCSPVCRSRNDRGSLCGKRGATLDQIAESIEYHPSVKQCIICGAYFSTENHKKCDGCRWKKQRSSGKRKRCLICGTEFTTMVGRLSCGDTCSRKQANKRRQARRKTRRLKKELATKETSQKKETQSVKNS